MREMKTVRREKENQSKRKEPLEGKWRPDYVGGPVRTPHIVQGGQKGAEMRLMVRKVKFRGLKERRKEELRGRWKLMR